MKFRHTLHLLKDKVLIVTGGTKSVGLKRAIQFAARGAAFSICSGNIETRTMSFQNQRQDISRTALYDRFLCPAGIRVRQGCKDGRIYNLI